MSGAPEVKFYQVGSFAAGNRLLGPDLQSDQADPARANALTSGHRACQGCGEALGARYILDAAQRAAGGKVIAVNATGCLEVFSTPYPETSWQLPWLHSLFGNAPAVAAGVAAALRAKGRTDIRVVGQGGDGGTVDIGLGCLSGMFERNDDVLYVCYDNEAYMNTGVQRSGATPPTARTATTQAVGKEPGAPFGQGKNLPLIAMAHEIPYVATATVAGLRDLEAKVHRAMGLRGARYLHVLVPCPLGWGTASCDTVKIARLAEQTGLFPVFEAVDGEVTDVTPIRRQLPAVMGRVCYHPCETACNRVQVDNAVGINSVERFLGDEAIKRGWTVSAPSVSSGMGVPPAGGWERVLVVGSGPAGLSAAYHLRLLGHEVTIREAQKQPGGMMRYGIPRYRLPREVLDAEIDRIVALGVTLELDTRVDDVLAAQRDGGFDAVFLAVGAGIGRRTYIPAGDSARILDAVALLAGMEGEDPPLLGRRVAVYGGGNTAMDAARTARRLGATDAVVVYRRTRDRMPAHDVEVEEALEEGVRMRWLSTIKQADGDHLTIERMRLDETGFPQPTGEFEELRTDTVVLALGQDSDLSLLQGVPDLSVDHGTVRVADGLMTGHQGIFAGGDMVPAERTVTMAVGHGKKAARHIDAYLRGTTYEPGAKHAPADFEKLNTWYYSDAPAAVRPRLELARRVSTFDEVTQGLDESTALFEARRCMSCGNCFECDNCYGVCPDNAITKLGPGKGFAIDLDYCKGCGLCVAECPCGAIEMVPEE